MPDNIGKELLCSALGALGALDFLHREGIMHGHVQHDIFFLAAQRLNNATQEELLQDPTHKALVERKDGKVMHGCLTI